VSAPAPYLGDITRSPVVACAISSLVCAFLGIGMIAAYLPDAPPLAWPAGFLVASAVLLLAALAFLARRRPFAWRLFFAVARWVTLVTAIFSAMAVYIFVADGTSGTTLAIMAAVLVLSAIDIPLLIGFSVARHERVAG
jgi:hypothetical protein